MRIGRDVALHITLRIGTPHHAAHMKDITRVKDITHPSDRQ